MTVADLLLDTARQAELAAALTNLGMTSPLEQCIAEAEATVGFYTRGYDVPPETRASWVRTLALARAYTLAGALSADQRQAETDVMTELKAIAAGERPGLPRLQEEGATSSPSGAWGSETRLTMRTGDADEDA